MRDVCCYVKVAQGADVAIGATLMVELTWAFCCLRAILGQPHVPRFASSLLIFGIFIILVSCELWCKFKYTYSYILSKVCFYWRIKGTTV